MSANTRTPAFWLALISTILSLSAVIAGCTVLARGGPGFATAPTAVPTAQTGQPPAGGPTAQPPAPTGEPTAVAPTAQPTLQPGQPTAQPQPGQPILGFNPKAGGPGTSVEAFGGGYEPGQWYTVRLGTPGPVGEALLTAQADANGRWGGRLIMPAALPSGQPIASGQVYLVVMDGKNRALASAAFAFTAPQPAPYPQSQQELVTALLNAYSAGRDVRPYLAPALAGEIDAGRPVDQVLGLHPVALRSFSFGQPYSYPAADIGFLPATLSYQGFSEERVFTIASDHAGSQPRLRVYGSELAREGRPVATSPEDGANRLLLEVWADRSGRRALPYLSGDLRERLARGEQVDLLEQGGTGPMLPMGSFQVGAVVAEDGADRWVEVTLDLAGQTGVKRFFKLTPIDGAWRAVAVANALSSEPPPASFPGPGWTAWKQGDFNGDGLEETVYLIESGAINYDRLDDPLLNANSLNATAVMVAQAGPSGPEVLLRIDGRSFRAADGHEGSFGSPGAAFFQVAVTYAYDGRFLHVLPLKGDGYALTQALAFKWDPTTVAYRPIGGPHGEW